MDSDTASASWHPAKRPNSSADDTPFEFETKSQSGHDDISSYQTQPTAVTTEGASEETTAPPPSEQFTSSEQASVPPPHDAVEYSHHEPDEEPGVFSQHTEAHPEAPAETPAEAQGEPSTLDDAEIEDTLPESECDPKHRSTSSFTRTIPHEVSFNDDEDVEWNIQPSETDFFSFMPENDRTNSFPAVSQVTDSAPDEFAHPPLPVETEEIVQVLETEQAHTDAFNAAPDFVEELEDNQEDRQEEESSFVQKSMGGDFENAEIEASEARYEEGIPLISQHDAPEIIEEIGDVENKVTSSMDFFAEDSGGAGDDFFSQIQDSQPQTDFPFDGGLQRKSTSMVMGLGIDPESASPLEEPESKVDDFADQAPSRDSMDAPEGAAEAATETTDLDAKWAAAFADDDDDDFLPDTVTETKELDPADIFGSDDEGFLEDEEEPTPAVSSQAQTPQPNLNNGFAPQPVQQQPYAAKNPYAPATVAPRPPLQQQPQYSSNAVPRGMGYGVPAPPKPEPPKAQSFVDKAKGGYQSPYDLPMDVVKPPKKRASAQQLPRANATPPMTPSIHPPRSASTHVPPPPAGSSTLSSPTSSHSNQQPSTGAPKPSPQLKSKPSFFEDLPMTAKSRPTSRQAGRPASTQQNPYGQFQAPPQGPPMGTPSMPTPPTPSQQFPPPQPAAIPTLVAPELTSPYAALQSDLPSRPQPPSSLNNRYSPAPSQSLGANGMVPAAPSNRYSPAPASSRAPSASYSAVPPPMLAHQPRTSSPLAHFEVSHGPASNGDGVPLARTNSSQFEHRATRVPSLPPTQEVEEEQLPDTPSEASPKPYTAVPPRSDYSPTQRRHNTPPPSARMPPPNPLSPTKRSMSQYIPQSTQLSPKESIVPPPRPQTQSPGASRSKRGVVKPMDSAPRPSSAHAPTLPQPMMSPQTTYPAPRARGMSQTLNLVPPTDGRELDPLQRWRGGPCFAWGVGGLFVSTFPKDVPRYGINSVVPQIIRSPGEVKVKHMKDIQPLEERLSKFPGPLKGKGKKKEVIAWLTAGITDLETALPNMSFQHHVSHEDKRAAERVLLWKILRVMVENDGVLEGNPAVEKAVRAIISPGLDATASEEPSSISTGADLTGMTGTSSVMQADATDSTVTESIRKHLLLGDREKAVWAAVDKRLWGHAILISSSMPNPELYRQVAQEFIKKEVNHVGHGNESLAALYSVLSGNFEEAVDELVPVHARAGLQLMSTSAPTESQDVLAGLDKWCETLGLILSNRRQGDVQALRSLGNLLSGYGRAEAAHICYIFARQCAVFGGLDDPNANFVLVGADHQRQADQCAKETEALQLSEVYEYGLSLAPGSSHLQGCPHLAAYKLQHAMVLAEYGFRDKALQYCEAIWSAITSQTKKSPYFNPVLESAVDDIMRRLKQAAGDEPSSWITKPKMDQVSSNMWSRFSKFVAGPDEDGNGNGASGEGGAEVGPFARIAGGTPAISRTPSTSNFDMYGASPQMPSNRAFSAYAPVPAQAGASPYEPTSAYNPVPRSPRTSGELPRNSSEFARRPDTLAAPVNPYAPVPMSTSSPTSAYHPVAPLGSEASPYASAYQSQPPAPTNEQSMGYPGYQPYGSDPLPESPKSPAPGYPAPETSSQEQAPANDTGFSLGYQPPSNDTYGSPLVNSYEPPATQAEPSYGGYEPPSYQPSSFEPPSYEPGPTDDDETESKPKKNFMNDDDDDDIPAMKPQGKSKADIDRENEEMFRRVAEEEAKRAEEEKAAKKSGGWGFSGWFGGSKKAAAEPPNKPIKAKLGEASSFVYDPDLKRWVNKKPGAENAPAKTATPPPPRANSTPPTSSTSAPPMGSAAPPPPSRTTGPPAGLNKAVSQELLSAPPGGAPPPMARTVSSQSTAGPPAGPPSAPPSRPATSLSNASSIDDLLGPAGPRKSAKKPRKSGRYVDVMAK